MHFRIRSKLSSSLKVDQSLAHDGVCLTVVRQQADWHEVVAIKETLQKSTLGDYQVNDVINLERCMVLGGRLDGHMVQGHIDTTGQLQSIEDQKGSWILTFEYPSDFGHLLIPKGSIAINGISLTLVKLTTSLFSVAIIPYTWHHTNLRHLQIGQRVNLEFDVIGKYLQRYREISKN